MCAESGDIFKKCMGQTPTGRAYVVSKVLVGQTATISGLSRMLETECLVKRLRMGLHTPERAGVGEDFKIMPPRCRQT